MVVTDSSDSYIRTDNDSVVRTDDEDAELYDNHPKVGKMPTFLDTPNIAIITQKFQRN